MSPGALVFDMEMQSAPQKTLFGEHWDCRHRTQMLSITCPPESVEEMFAIRKASPVPCLSVVGRTGVIWVFAYTLSTCLFIRDVRIRARTRYATRRTRQVLRQRKIGSWTECMLTGSTNQIQHISSLERIVQIDCSAVEYCLRIPNWLHPTRSSVQNCYRGQYKCQTQEYLLALRTG